MARVGHKLQEHYPNCGHVIREGLVQAVLNTPSPSQGPLRDGIELRRAAVERRIPCFTSLDTARVAIRALASTEGFNVRPLPDYLRGPASRQEERALPGVR